MTDSEESCGSVKSSEDVMMQSAFPEIKMCFVQLEKLDFPEKLKFPNDSDSSDDDLPQLPCFQSKSRPEQKIQKSNKELMEEHEKLAKNIQIGILSDNQFEEKLKEIAVVQMDEVESISSPAPAENEEKDIKLLFINDALQYFNMLDVTLEQCGYDRRNEDLTEYEKMMLSFKRVELERVLSSTLFSSNISCISDLKSFVTFLLRNLSVHLDVESVITSYNVVNMLLEKHPNAKTLNFSSAEIFMLLFNYGIDINGFKSVVKRMDIQKYLEEPKDKCKNKIPEDWNWMFNFKKTLNAILSLIINCEFNVKHLCDIIIYFMWLSLDSSLLRENIFSTVRECIGVCLERVPTEKWSKVMREVACTFITEDFLHSEDQWSYVYHMVESIPVTSKRGLQLRKYISFLVLIEFDKLTEETLEKRTEVNKTLNGFSLRELKSLLQRLVRNRSDVIVNFSSKFLNICLSYLEGSDEDIMELCNILKNSESALDERAYEAKTRFVKIHSRLKITHGKRCIYNVVTSEDNGTLSKKVKKLKKVIHDADIENVPGAYPFEKVKEEPVH